MSAARTWLVPLIVLLAAIASARTLTSKESCNRCEGTALPGRTVPHPVTRWGIISDLPESFGSHGVLYSTREVLPANGGAPELLRQRSADVFRTIDGGFDVFLFHLCKVTTMSSRLVVYVKNRGVQPVVVRPRQVIKSEGIIGRVHEFESELARRVLDGRWDVATTAEAVGYPVIEFRPGGDIDNVMIEIAPGEGRIIAYGKQFGNVEDGPESSRNVNCFGYVRAQVDGERGVPAHLEVSVVAIPAGARENMLSEAERLLDLGAVSTDEVSTKQPPQSCALGRAVGVYPNFVWSNDPIEIDLATMGEAGTTFSMALPEVQTRGCADARQTTDLVRYPGYTRPDTIGNYMVEYEVQVTLTNSGETERVGAVTFGKTGADVGLAYEVADIDDGSGVSKLNMQGPVLSAWAGPGQSALEKVFSGLERVTVAGGKRKKITLRFMICGNSSLPFTLGVRPAR